MRIRGREVSKWWLLLLTPVLLLALPVLLMLFFIGNSLAGAIVGPPAIWNRTSQTPPRQDLVGSYEGSYRAPGKGSAERPVSLSLRGDGSMAVSGMPYEFYPMTCTLSGTGTWVGPFGETRDLKIDLRITSDGNAGACASGEYGAFELAGHGAPYKLYWVIGDPDSGEGVWMSRMQ
jgi:hypothetical protein